VLRDDDGALLGFAKVLRDNTARREQEEAVRQSEARLRALNDTLESRVAERTAELAEANQRIRRLASEIVLAEQRVHRDIARRLHDDLQQRLYGVQMKIAGLRLRGHLSTPQEVGSQLDDVERWLAEAVLMTRHLAVDLSPPVLAGEGLAEALGWLADQMREMHGLQTEIRSNDSATVQDEDLRVLLFQSVRELLFNVVKHADVHEARLELKRIDEHRIQLVVEDRGAGFDPDSVIGARQESFGLFSLRERIQFLGGQLQIVSRQGEGTRVTVELPLPEPTAEAPYELMPPSDHIEWSQPAGGHAAIRVLLADDHRILREGVVGILAEHADISVVAEAANGREALELARQHHPDVVVMDVTMPVLNGIEATRLISEQLPDVHIIGLTMHDSPDMAASMKEAGARDVLVKDGPSDALIAAIRTAAGRGQPHAG
jgi:signal transduction histidine kinase/ActR/RegA family two-component response regulator